MLVATSICGIASYATAIAPSIPVYLAGLFLYGFAYLFLGPYLIVGVSSQLDPSGLAHPLRLEFPGGQLVLSGQWGQSGQESGPAGGSEFR